MYFFDFGELGMVFKIGVLVSFSYRGGYLFFLVICNRKVILRFIVLYYRMLKVFYYILV